MFVYDAERICNWICEKAGGAYTNLCTAIGIEIDGELKVAVMYENFTGGNICMVWRVDDPKCLSKKFYWMAFDYPFNQLDVHRVTGIVRTDNEKAIKINNKLGFEVEFTLKRFLKDSDALVFVMFKENCRFIKGKYD